MEVATKVKFLGSKHIIGMACWKVRPLYQTGKTHQLTREISRYKVDICGISESRWRKSGKINLTTGDTMVFSCHDEDKCDVQGDCGNEIDRELRKG